MTIINFQPRPGPRRTARGLGISVLVHIGALVWLTRPPAPHPDTGAAPRRMLFVLLSPAPGAPPAPPGVPAPPAPARQSAARHAATAQRDAPAPPATPVIASEPAAAAAPPAFDIMAARAAARALAREDRNALAGLPDGKLAATRDQHVEQLFERARRRDCQTARAESVNLVANIAMLAVDLVKNAVDDSGCKW